MRGYKIRQLFQSGWKVSHCPGEYQKADLLTKALPSARMQFLCQLLQLGGEEREPQGQVDVDPAVRSVGAVSPSCLASVVALLQFCNCCGETVGEENEDKGLPIEWPWELAFLTVLIVLSTLFLWEKVCGSRVWRGGEEPRVRAVTTHKERRAKKLQNKVAAAIDSAMSESPTGDETVPKRRGRNKCSDPSATVNEGWQAPSPTVVYGGINVQIPQGSSSADSGQRPGCSSEVPTAREEPQGSKPEGARPTGVVRSAEPSRPADNYGFRSGIPARAPSPLAYVTRSMQTDPVIVLDPGEYVYVSGGGDCVHRSQDCRGLRRAFNIKPKAVCQYCLAEARGVR